MQLSDAYWPPSVFAPESSAGKGPRRVFISPQRYVQGAGVLQEMGRFFSLVEARRAGILISERGERTDGVKLIDGLSAAGIEHHVSRFGGECSLEEIGRHYDAWKENSIDCVLAVGGGKCIDTGKAVAFRLELPVVIAPTLASNDAPCSALSVIYSEEGVSVGAEFYPNSPALVVVDTAIVAAAPVRYLVAGIGDAMATWYEADACARNDKGVTVPGTRPTLAALAIARSCAERLFAEGLDAVVAVNENRINDAMENVVEANTLLSGLGFESGGLAAAHGFAQAFTALPSVEANYLHGEMVAMGVLGQLALEKRKDEATRVADFFARVGLPVHLGQLGVEPSDRAAVDKIVEGALAFPFINNMPLVADGPALKQALLDAHGVGAATARTTGDAAYRGLHAC